MSPDPVDRIVAQWARERPDVDASPMEVIGRIHRLAVILDAKLRPVFAGAGLGDGEFDVLATLRRSGAPYALSPSELSASMMVTGGAVTKRVDRLIERGLVARDLSDVDGRGRRISLTHAGLEVVNDLVSKHVAKEDALLAALDDDDRAQLAALLRRLLEAHT